MAWVGNSVKFLLLLGAIAGVISAGFSGGAAANPSMPCPALQIEAACGAKGAEISLKLGADAPEGVSFLITAQGEGQIAEGAAQSLAAGDEVLLHPLGAAGSQLTLAVLGLEGVGNDTPCCFSNQRLHVPECAVEVLPEDITPAPEPDPVETDVIMTPPPKPTSDLAVDLTLNDSCQAHEGAAFCEGSLTLTATGPQLANEVLLTLSSRFAEDLRSDGFACSDIADGQSQCQLAYPAPRDSYYLVLKSAAISPDVQLCATLDVADISDTDASNNQSCATAIIPAPALICEPETAQLDGGECLCKFNGMEPISANACACPKGTVLREGVCDVVIIDPPLLQCDEATTVLRNGVCECRYEGMIAQSETACSCESGLPPSRGMGCDLPILDNDIIKGAGDVVVSDPIPVDPKVLDILPVEPNLIDPKLLDPTLVDPAADPTAVAP